MKDEKQVHDYIQGIEVNTHARTDAQFLEQLRAEHEKAVNQRHIRPWIGTMAAAFAILLSINAVLLFQYLKKDQTDWNLEKSLRALHEVDSFVMKAYSSSGQEYIVHVKGNPYMGDDYRARLESNREILVLSGGNKYSIGKNPLNSIGLASYDAFSDELPPIRRAENDNMHPAVGIPDMGCGTFEQNVIIEKVERKSYYVVTGTHQESGDRFSTVFDAESSLPVKSTIWKGGKRHHFVQSEVLQYNSFIPDEIYEIGLSK